MEFQSYEGLIPEFGGGRPSKLTKDQKEELREMLKKKDSWTTREVQELIESEFGVSYSSWQVRRILRFRNEMLNLPERLRKAR